MKADGIDLTDIKKTEIQESPKEEKIDYPDDDIDPNDIPF